MFRRLTLCLLTTCVGTLIVVGCGSASPSSPEGVTAAPSTSTPTVAAPTTASYVRFSRALPAELRQARVLVEHTGTASRTVQLVQDPAATQLVVALTCAPSPQPISYEITAIGGELGQGDGFIMAGEDCASVDPTYLTTRSFTPGQAPSALHVSVSESIENTVTALSTAVTVSPPEKESS